MSQRLQKLNRPQTAFNVSSSTNATGEPQQVIEKRVYPSCLSPTSLQKLREAQYQKQDQEQIPYPYNQLKCPQKRYEVTKSQPHYIHVSQDVAEIQMPTNYFAKETKQTNEEYHRFKENFNKIVFDSYGNYIYTKPDPQPPEIKLLESNRRTINSKALRKKMMAKTQEFEPKKIINNIFKSSQEQAQMNPKRKAILDAKNKSETSLKTMINNIAKEKIFFESKAILNQTSLEMMNEVDTFLRENQTLKEQLEIVKNQNIELQGVNESLHFKNIMIIKELKETKEKLETIKRSSTEIEKFIPQWKLLVTKFPEFSAQKLIDKYEYLENTCLDMTKKISELEMNIILEQRTISQLKNDYAQQIQVIMQSKLSTSNEYNPQRNEADLQETQIQKDQHNLLFKKILQIYCDWTAESKVFYPDKADCGPSAKLNEPIEMLNIMEKMIKISTDFKLQSYLRKIIVSAHLLQRKFLPDHVNEQFDPDKIYDRIVKLLEKLYDQISKLQIKNKALQKKCGPRIDTIEESAQESKILFQND